MVSLYWCNCTCSRSRAVKFISEIESCIRVPRNRFSFDPSSEYDVTFPGSARINYYLPSIQSRKNTIFNSSLVKLIFRSPEFFPSTSTVPAPTPFSVNSISVFSIWQCRGKPISRRPDFQPGRFPVLAPNQFYVTSISLFSEIEFRIHLPANRFSFTPNLFQEGFHHFPRINYFLLSIQSRYFYFGVTVKTNRFSADPINLIVQERFRSLAPNQFTVNSISVFSISHVFSG